MSTNPNAPNKGNTNSPRYGNRPQGGGRGQNPSKRNVWTRRNPPSEENGQFQSNQQDTDNLSQKMGSLNMQDNQQQRPYKNARPPRDSTNGNGEPSRSDDQRQFDKKDKKKRDKKFNQQQNQPQQTNQSPQSPTQDDSPDAKQKSKQKLSLAEFYNSVNDEFEGNPQDEEPSRVLWVGNIGPDVTEEELEQEFGQYGKIESLRILHNRYCAFVNFEEEAAAKEAKKNLHGTIIGSQYIVIHYRKPELAKVLPQPGVEGPFVLNSPSRALWIGNVSDKITEDELKREFEQFGKIESIRVLRNKTCAFVNFMNVEEASAALQALQGKKLGNMAIKINFGKPQTAIPKSMNPLDPMNQQFLAPGFFPPEYAAYGMPGVMPPGMMFPPQFMPVMDAYGGVYDPNFSGYEQMYVPMNYLYPGPPPQMYQAMPPTAQQQMELPPAKP